MRSLTWGCGQEEDPAGRSGGGRRIQRCLCEGRRVRGSAGTPRAIRGGRRILQPLPQEGASAGRGSGEEDPAKSFTEGGGSGETRQSVCLARSGIRGQAGVGGGGRSRGSLRVLRRDPAGTRVGGGRSWDPGVGGERGSRGGGVSPGSRSNASGRVGRSAGVLRGRGGGTQRLSPSLPLALSSSARRAGGAGLSAAGPVPRSSAPPPLPPVPPWGAEEPLPPLPPPRPFCR